MKSNNEVYSAFRTHRMQNDIAAQLTDSDGKLKPFEQFRKDTEAITDHHVRQWLHTEYDTAVLRAHQAADWQQYEADKDIFPNLRWIPSTSANPGEYHMPFWDTVLPVDDPFWNVNQPGNLWNCKCDWEETNAEPTTRGNDIKHNIFHQGLQGNPGTNGQIFSKDASYFANNKAVSAKIDYWQKTEYRKKYGRGSETFNKLLKEKTVCNADGKEKDVVFDSFPLRHYAQSGFDADFYCLKNQLMPHLKDYIKNAKFVKREACDLSHNKGIKTLRFKQKVDYFYYFETELPNGKKVFFHLARYKADGVFTLYSITQNLK